MDWECMPSSSSPSLVVEKSSINKNVTSSNILKNPLKALKNTTKLISCFILRRRKEEE
jgi:hypothetical protein